MKLAIGILLVGIITLSSAAPYEVATEQEKLAKLESLLGRALRRTVREQNDDNGDDDLADLLAIMEEDDSSEGEGAKAEKFHFNFRKLKKIASNVWNHGGKQIAKQIGGNILKKHGLGELSETLIPAKLQDDNEDGENNSQATIEELLALLQDDDDDSNDLTNIEDVEDGTDTSDNSEATIEELLAQLQDDDNNLADIEDTPDGTGTTDGGKVAKLQLREMIGRIRGRLHNFINRIRRRFRGPPRPVSPPGPAPPPVKPKVPPSRRQILLRLAEELLD